MNKRFKYYAIVWALMLAVYNVQAVTYWTVLPDSVSRNNAGFWLSWAFVVAAYIGQLYCGYIACKSENKDKLFLNMPLVVESYAAITLMTGASCTCLRIPNLPSWVTSVDCAVILATSAIAVVKAKAAAEIVGGVDEKVKMQTFFIKTLTADANTLLASTDSIEMKGEIKKVCEAVRYE